MVCFCVLVRKGGHLSQAPDLVLFVLGTSCDLCGKWHETDAHARWAVRDFLRFVSREEGETRLRVVRPDQQVVGEITRARLSASLDRLDTRVRQVVRLYTEQGMRRADIAKRFYYSQKTIDRDIREALDALFRVVVGEMDAAL